MWLCPVAAILMFSNPKTWIRHLQWERYKTRARQKPVAHLFLLFPSPSSHPLSVVTCLQNQPPAPLWQLRRWLCTHQDFMCYKNRQKSLMIVWLIIILQANICVCLCMQVKTSLYQPPELPCLGHIQTSISAVGEDGLIYVRTQNAGTQRSRHYLFYFLFFIFFYLYILA